MIQFLSGFLAKSRRIERRMKKLVGIIMAMALIVPISLGLANDVKAETVYVVNGGAVYGTTTENPFYYYAGYYPGYYLPYWGYANYPAGFYPNMTPEQWQAYYQKAIRDGYYSVVPGWSPYVWASPAAPPVAPTCAPAVTTYNPYYANVPYNILPYCY